jgi:WD40 repeat protein
VKLWESGSGRPPLDLGRHGAAVCLVAYTPDGKSLVSVSCDGGLISWDLASRTKSLERSLPGAVHDAALAPDGIRLATANANGTVYLLRLKHGPRAK